MDGDTLFSENAITDPDMQPSDAYNFTLYASKKLFMDVAVPYFLKLREENNFFPVTCTSYSFSYFFSSFSSFLQLFAFNNIPLNRDVETNDYLLALYIFVFFFILRALLSGCLMPSFQNFLPYPLFYVIAKRSNFVLEKRTHKFSENLWYLLWHSFSLIWVSILLYIQLGTSELPGWVRLHLFNPSGRHYVFLSTYEYYLSKTGEALTSDSFISAGWPLIHMPYIVKMYYIVQLSFWLSCFVFVFIETRRNDFYVMTLHHVVTVILIAFSLIYNYWKFGQIILFLHDAVDVLLYTTKVLLNTKINKKIVDAIFIIFAFSYFVFRLVFFVFYCLWPVVNINEVNFIADGLICVLTAPGGCYLPFFLIVLLCLHFYWFRLIILMILRSLKKAKITEDGDIRSDDENESEAMELKKDDKIMNEKKIN